MNLRRLGHLSYSTLVHPGDNWGSQYGARIQVVAAPLVAHLRSLPFLKADTGHPNQTSGFLPLGLAEGTDPETIRFPELGYAREARASYRDFTAARSRGDVAPGTRFQVSLPTPFAVINSFVLARDVLTIEPAYERAMLGEVAAICGAIPHRDLCIQWDICIEMVLWDGRWPFMSNPFADLRTEVITRLKRLAVAVPEDVDLGFHLCYGDWDAKHFIEPEDSRKLVEFANALTAAVARPIAYIHMPVPINRSDDAYFAPLSRLELPESTELYLGLVHDDGAEATRRRIRAGGQSQIGVWHRCGMRDGALPHARTRSKASHDLCGGCGGAAPRRCPIRITQLWTSVASI